MNKKYSPIVLAILAATSSQAFAANPHITQRDETDIEEVLITASPIRRTILESTSPVSILSGEQLDQHQAATLGETLKNVPGVHSSYFGPVASTPIIRGLSGPRVQIVQNGLGVSDASRVGPDHQVSTETSTASQIEVLRGPATLLYGSGAIGGVVNVVDDRLPADRVDGVRGNIFAQYEDVANAKTESADVNAGSGDFVFHVDGYNRDTHDYDIPVPADINEHGHGGKLANSAIDAHGYNLGGGWLTDDTRVALAYGRMDSEYGLPGEEGVFIKLQQDRYQGAADWNNLNGFIKSIHWRSAYTDYEHSEMEGEEVGTSFENDSVESRLWAEHKAINGWNGVGGAHYKTSDFEAIGEEAFTPPTTTDSFAVFLTEEKRTGDLLWQLGTRVEQVNLDVDNRFFSAMDSTNPIDFDDQDYTAFSGSAGVIWTLDEQNSIAFNYAYSERAPSASESFAYGPHIGSGTYEIGGEFDIVEGPAGYTVTQSAQNVDKEKANNIDVTYRFHSDTVDASFSLFADQIDNYIYEDFTDLVISDGQIVTQQAYNQDVAINGPSDEEADGLPVIVFAQQDAKLYGYEAQLDWHMADAWRLNVFSDYTRAKLDEGGNVPRISPMRVGSSLHYEMDNWHSEVEVVHNSRQDKVAANETETKGYTILSASANYYLELDRVDMTFYVKGDNLTDEEARVHSSYLKDEAPLPGRNLSLGVRMRF